MVNHLHLSVICCVLSSVYGLENNNTSIEVKTNLTFVDILRNFVENNSEPLDAVQNENTTTLRFATPCETPNHEPALCLPIKQCPTLLKQIYKPKAKKFLIDSKCGPKGEDLTNPKVCCGKYGHYKKEATTPIIPIDKVGIDEDGEINNPLPKKCGSQAVVMRGRIYGGKQAELGEFPWMARLIHKNNYNYKTFGCAGFLVAAKYVVTAAHCLVSDSLAVRGPLFSVSLGEHDTRHEIDCSKNNKTCAPPTQEIRIKKQIVHPLYDKNDMSHHNDIAIIQLANAASLSNFVQPICLLADKKLVPYKYFISGWGKTETSSYSNVKRKVDVPAYDITSCHDKYHTLDINIDNTQICAGGSDNKDSCTGDSGGPLMMTTDGVKWYAAGLVSYGLGCGREDWPGVYTSIPMYLQWIKEELYKLATQ